MANNQQQDQGKQPEAQAESSKPRTRKPVVMTIVKNCAVNGKPLKEGRELTIGKDINEEDAKELLKMGRAELVEDDKK